MRLICISHLHLLTHFDHPTQGATSGLATTSAPHVVSFAWESLTQIFSQCILHGKATDDSDLPHRLLVIGSFNVLCSQADYDNNKLVRLQNKMWCNRSGCVAVNYTALSISHGIFCPKNSEFMPHNSPTRARYAGFFLRCRIWTKLLIFLLCPISRYIRPWYIEY